MTVEFVIAHCFHNILVRLMELTSNTLNHITYKEQIILRYIFTFEKLIRHMI